MSTRKGRIREATYAMKWHGFNIKPGFLYGRDQTGDYIVWTGKLSDVTKNDDRGRPYSIGKKALLFRAREAAIKDVFPDAVTDPDAPLNWESKWVNCGSGIGKTILEKSVKRTCQIVPDYAPTTPAGRHLFKNDKNRFPTYSAEAYKYQGR